MTTFGQSCLLVALVGSGYAVFATAVGRRWEHRALSRSGAVAAIAGVLALTAAIALLAWALVAKDFRFAYVAQYSSRQLAWYYSLSACWVGQAGSLLVWAWLVGVLTLAYRFWPQREPSPLREPAFAIATAYLCFLVAVMVFGADPMEPSIGNPGDGAGLGPLLQHPVMLVHPPLVFLGYSCYVFPFALAMAALVSGQIDLAWPRQIRRWSLVSWTVLGIGILLGADWAYEELGWGGYWGWDPVENGSLIPWLTGTALLHTSMAWQHRGILKKTTLLLAIATFGLCNFAAFVTRSGIFSSVHQFSRSPVGWMFLGLMAGVAVVAGILLMLRRAAIPSGKPIASVAAREVLMILACTALVLLAAIALLGTLSVPLSDILLGRRIVVGTAFYNNALIPIGLILLATTALAPLSRWGSAPSPAQRALLIPAGGLGIVAAVVAFTMGIRHEIALAVAGLSAAAAGVLVGAVVLDVVRRPPRSLLLALFQTLRDHRRQYAGFLIHAGFVCVAVGVTGSSLGTIKHEAQLSEGQSIQWAGRTIRFARLIQRALPDRIVIESQLEVSRGGSAPFTLLPAQHYHRLHGVWTSEVAIHAAWTEDFYAILHGGEGRDRVRLTFVVNPMMRWLWLGGWVAGIGAIWGLLPARRPAARQSIVAAPHWIMPQAQHGRKPCEGAMADKGTIAIKATGLSKVLGKHTVLRKLDLEIAAGQTVALTGANGAGKTTLLRCLAGLSRPTAGEVRWFGNSASAGVAVRRLVGTAAHESLLYPHLTARENLVFAARMHDVPQPARRAGELIRSVSLDLHADRLATELSRGMRQRLAVLRALVHDPPILLLDEPFAGLDEAAANWLLGLFSELRDRGRTVCFATHDAQTAQDLADRILRLQSGRLERDPQRCAAIAETPPAARAA